MAIFNSFLFVYERVWGFLLKLKIGSDMIRWYSMVLVWNLSHLSLSVPCSFLSLNQIQIPAVNALEVFRRSHQDLALSTGLVMFMSVSKYNVDEAGDCFPKWTFRMKPSVCGVSSDPNCLAVERNSVPRSIFGRSATYMTESFQG